MRTSACDGLRTVLAPKVLTSQIINTIYYINPLLSIILQALLSCVSIIHCAVPKIHDILTEAA